MPLKKAIDRVKKIEITQLHLSITGEDREIRRGQETSTSTLRVCVKMHCSSFQCETAYRHDAAAYQADSASIGDHTGAISGKQLLKVTMN